MKLINKTSFNTVQFKSFIREVALREDMTKEEIRKLNVEVIYRRKSSNWKDDYVTGYAYYGKPIMCIKMPRDVMPDKAQMAKTIAHELVHTQGVHHTKAMRSSRYGWVEGWKDVWSWALALPLDIEVEKKESKEVVILSKVEHCEKMISLWERKAKLAKTKQKKWMKKLEYYRKRKASVIPESNEVIE